MTLLATHATSVHRYDGQMMWDGGGWMWLWGSLMMLAVIATVLAGVRLVVRGTGRPESPPGERAREILAERYARGELSTDEYHERLDALR